MGNLFLAVTTIFVIAEVYAAYLQYFDFDQKEQLCPGFFEGYTQFKVENPTCSEEIGWHAQRTIEFFALWVGNSKIIFSMLLVCISLSSCSKTRIAGSACMVVGCLIYFPRMAPLLREIETSSTNNDTELLSEKVADLIGKVFVPMWTAVFVAEILASRKQASLTTKSMKID